VKIGMHAVYEESFATAIRQAHVFGFDYVQFDLGAPQFYLDDVSGSQLGALQRMSHDYGIGLTFHAPGDYVGLFLDHPDIRSGMLDHFRKIIDAAMLLESHHITFHPLSPPSFRMANSRTSDFEQVHFDHFRQVFVDNVSVLDSATGGPLICIENYKFGPTAIAALEQLFQKHNRVALTWDIPKSMDRYDKPNSIQHAFFQRYAERIREVHFHDLDATHSHLAPGDGCIDFELFRDVLTAESAWVTIEVRPAPMAAKAKEWLLRFAKRALGGALSNADTT